MVGTLQFQRQLFLTFHRKLTCAMDQWYPLTMADIREMERKAKEELEETLAKRKLQTAGGKSHDKADGKGGQSAFVGATLGRAVRALCEPEADALVAVRGGVVGAATEEKA